MKRTDLIRLLTENGWFFVRNGANHDVYSDGKHFECIPRHREVNEMLARTILRKYDIKKR